MNRYAPDLIPLMVPKQFMAVPGAAVPLPLGMSSYNRQSAAQLPGIQQQLNQPSSHRGSGGNQDFRQRDDDRRFAGRRPGNRWQSDAEVELDEPNIDESLVVLDHFNSDLHLVIDKDGYGGSVLNDPPGFCFTWAGARATYGACRGKVYYEVHVVEHLPADFGDDHNETDPHIVRLGWSIDSSSFQLGEEPWSYGYGGTGKFSTNNRFTDYGGRFEAGDVIGAMVDLDSRPATISYTKNGTWLGVATPLHGLPVGTKEKALYPHILSKNCRFKVNFGQMDAWYPPPKGFRYIGQLPLTERVRGMVAPARKSDCEMIMIVGLPGAGKTTWGINMEKNHPDKRYNIIGTDTLIEKMRVMGLPRKRNYHGRWDVLIDKATKCLNKLFSIAAKRRRNYILDQTNVYGTARRRKMKNFAGFYRIAAVIQPDDPELERRSYKRTHEDGKFVPEAAVLEMKANYSIPEERDNLFDRIDFVELKKDGVQQLVTIYNGEGKTKAGNDNSQNRFDSNRKQGDQRQQQYGGFKPQPSFDDKNFALGKREHGYFDQNESAVKRGRQDSGAYGIPRHQYEESDRQPPTQPVSTVGRSGWSDPLQIKEEPGVFRPDSQWSSAGYTQDLNPSHSAAFRAGLLGAPPTQGQNQYRTTSQGYESQFDQDSTRQQTAPSWQQEQGETAVRSQAREPGTAAGSWQSGWKGREDAQGVTSRESGSRESSLSQRDARDTDRGRDRNRERERNRDGDKDRDRVRDRERDRNGDRDRDRNGDRDRDRHTDRDRERDRDRNSDRNSDYNRSNSDRGGVSSIDRTRQDVGYGSNDRSRQDGGYSGSDRTRQDGSYSSNDRARQDGVYSGSDRTRQDGGYSGSDRTSQDAGYSSTDRTRQDAGYTGTDRTRQDAGYSGIDRTRQDGGYSGIDRTRQDGGYSGIDRTRQDVGYSGIDRTRQDGGYSGIDRTRPDGGYSGIDRTRQDGGYSGIDRTRQDGAYSGIDRTRQDGGYGSNDYTRQDRGYTLDSVTPSWNTQSYGSGSSAILQNYESDARRPDRQQEYASQWGLPGQDQVAFSDQIKQEVDVAVFPSRQNMFSQSSEGFRRPAPFSSAGLPARHPGSLASSKFDTDFPQAQPRGIENIKTELVDPITPESRKSSGNGLLGQPRLKPLIPTLEENETDQFKKEEYVSDRLPARQTPAAGSDASQPKRSSSSTSSSRRSFPPASTEGRFASSTEDKQPKPLVSPEERKPELTTAPPSGDVTASISSAAKDGPGKPGSIPATDTLEADGEPWNGPLYKPRGAGLPPPVDDMEPRRPPRGPPHYGSFGGPPRGPMGGPPHGFRGPAPWNSNHSRFGPPRPYFAGPPGRWPRPPR